MEKDKYSMLDSFYPLDLVRQERKIMESNYTEEEAKIIINSYIERRRVYHINQSSIGSISSINCTLEHLKTAKNYVSSFEDENLKQKLDVIISDAISEFTEIKRNREVY